MAIDTDFVNGADKLRARIETIRRNLNLPALTTEIAVLLRRRTLDRFDREVDPNETPWVPLATHTLAEKRRKGYGAKGKLKRTDKLRDSIRLIRGGLGTVYTNTGAGFRIGIDDPTQADKARALNAGTARIPARRFLGIGRLDIKAVDSLLRRKARQLENL